jgi:sugar-specific transcriptional regulator TrmB
MGLVQSLEKLNFSTNEARVYLTLSKMGPSLAGNISKESKLDRSSTYNALKGLKMKGVVSTIHENKRTIFIPENPKRLLNYLDERKEIAKNIIPEIEQNFNNPQQLTSVKLYKGFGGVKTALFDLLESCDSKTTHYLMSSEGSFSKLMPSYARIFKARKEKKRIKSKVLVRTDRDKKNLTKYAEYRAVPSDVVSDATINIYKDKISIVIWEDDPLAVIIKNPSVSRTFENYFKYMWKFSKKLK